MPPKRKRMEEDHAQSPQKKQAVAQNPSSVPVLLPELIENIINHLRWKDLPSAILVCSQWLNIIKKNGRDYECKYMKEYGGTSAFTYDTILEDPEREDEEYMELTWKEKYAMCNEQVTKMKGAKRRLGDDPLEQMLTVWALENGHHAFFKKIVHDGQFTNLEYYQQNIMEIVQERNDLKLLKIILTDLSQDQQDELDIFTILVESVQNNDIRAVKKLFKYGFKPAEDVGQMCLTSAVLSKNYDMLKLFLENGVIQLPNGASEINENTDLNEIKWKST